MKESINNRSLWQLVIFLVIVFFVIIIWAVNLNNSWDKNKLIKNDGRQQISEITSRFNDSLVSLKAQLDSQKNILSSTTDARINNSENVNNQIEESLLSDDSQPRVDNSLDVASTSATTTVPGPVLQTPNGISSEPSLANCPQYINCMPTIDVGRPSCQVPVGCENITVIAY